MIASKPIARSNAIPLFNGADPASFHQRHIDGFGLPAIIKGAIDHWPARHKWTLDYFTDLIGETEVTLKTNLINPNSQQTRQVFRDFVAGIKTGTFEAHLDESGLRFSPYFICNMGMFQHHNLLTDVDLVVPFVRDLQRQLQFGLDEVVFHLPFANIFIGPGGTRTKLHKDYWDTHTFICQIEGHKKVFMYAPNWEQDLIKADGRVFDPKHPVYADFPAARDAPCYEGVLEPGDMLFVPSNWLHDVESLDTSISFSWNFYTSENVAGYISHLMLDPLTIAKGLMDHPRLRPLVEKNYTNYENE